jgi:hypothetical protein
VWELIALSYTQVFALPFGMDKTIAHTKGDVRSHGGLYKPMM